MFGSNNPGQLRWYLAARRTPFSALSRVLLVVLLISVIPLYAWAASSSPLTVSVAPGSATAGSATALIFTFDSSVSSKGSVSIKVPPSSGAPWSPPQASNSSLPGFVEAKSGTCHSASVASASGGTMMINFKCRKRDTFQVIYGGGTAKANAATLVGNYTFMTTLVVGKKSAAVPVQPTIAVNPGPAARFTVTGLVNVVAGTSQLGMVTAFDQFNNVATGYNGTVDFASSDPQTGVLSDMSEMAANGLAFFGVSFKTAGSQSVTASDSVNSAITGMDTVTVSPAAAARLAVTGLVNAAAGTPQTATATAYDIFGNVVTGYDGTVNFTTSDGQAGFTPNSVMASLGVASALTALRTAGPQSVTATDSVNSAITGTEDVTISAAQGASIQVIVSPLPQTAYVWKDPVGCSVGAFLLDAYGNHVTSSDLLHFTSTDPLAHIPATLTPGLFTVGLTGFTTQGQQTVTATDPSIIVPSTQKPLTGSTTVTVIGPVAVDDQYYFLDPTHSATSVYSMNALQNDLPDDVGGFLLVNGNEIDFGYSTITQQPEYTDASNQVHQVGLLSITENGDYLAWDLNPAVAPAVPQGVIYDTCPTATTLTTPACNIANPITAAYTVTDGFNISSPATITMNLTTPSTPEVIGTTPNVTYQGGGGNTETVSVVGMGSTQITVEDPAISATATSDPTIPDDGAVDVTMSFKPTIVSGCTADCMDLSKCTICPDTVTLMATAVVPSGLGVTSTGSATPLLASVATPLFNTPLRDLWSSNVNFSGGIPTPTGLLPVTLINPNFVGLVPPTFFGEIFEASTIAGGPGASLAMSSPGVSSPGITFSCELAGKSTPCPNVLISLDVAGATVAPANTPPTCDSELVFCGNGPPTGQLAIGANSWSLNDALPVDVILSQTAANATGTVTINVFSELFTSCGTNCATYAAGSSFVVGTQDITQGAPNFSFKFPSAGYWAVQAVYSGDANDNTSGAATVYDVTN